MYRHQSSPNLSQIAINISPPRLVERVIKTLAKFLGPYEPEAQFTCHYSFIDATP